MIKTKWQQNCAWVVLGMSFLGCSNTLAASQSAPFVEGRHFLSLTEEIKENDVVENFKKESTGKVQVVEFFSYGCSWCYKLDPIVDKWVAKKPSYVSFQRVPVEFQPSWRTLTKAYYTAENLPSFHKLHNALFKAIHTDELTNSSEETLKAFFVDNGVKAEDFEQAFSSFDVNRKQKWANSISQAYRITAIPTVLVQGSNGAYLTSVRMAGSEDKLLKVIDYLVGIERQNLVKNPQ